MEKLLVAHWQVRFEITQQDWMFLKNNFVVPSHKARSICSVIQYLKFRKTDLGNAGLNWNWRSAIQIRVLNAAYEEYNGKQAYSVHPDLAADIGCTHARQSRWHQLHNMQDLYKKEHIIAYLYKRSETAQINRKWAL